MWLDRLNILIGNNNIEKLKNTTVLIIGLGGVGGYALESIARSGINNIIIVDKDIVDITNLNRQIITNTSNVGENKVDIAEQRAKLINPNVNIIKINEFITPLNIEKLFENKIDYLIDACDSVETKKQIIRECVKRKIKFITCMGTAKKMDPTKLEIIDIRKTSGDPIARMLRKMIKDEKIKEKVTVVCSKELPKDLKKLGSNSFVPAVAGLYCSSYIINDIVGDSNEIS